MPSSPFKFRERWSELQADGYIQFIAPGDWRLTERGLVVLMACADRPQIKTQLTKTSLATERMRTDAERSRQTRDNNSERGHNDA
jgi:hypothetical protein